MARVKEHTARESICSAAKTGCGSRSAAFRDTPGAKVTGSGPVRYSVFVDKKGERAMVLVNMSSSEAITAKVELPLVGNFMSATPENSTAQSINGTANLPARSAAVVMEQ
jgi:hypothetical protein